MSQHLMTILINIMCRLRICINSKSLKSQHLSTLNFGTVTTELILRNVGCSTTKPQK